MPDSLWIHRGAEISKGSRMKVPGSYYVVSAVNLRAHLLKHLRHSVDEDLSQAPQRVNAGRRQLRIMDKGIAPEKNA